MLSALFDKITRISIRTRWIVLALSLIIIVAGIVAMLGLNLELLPSIEFPQTVVVVQWPEAESSEQFLQEITIPLEEQLSEVPGVVNVQSSTTSGFAFVVVLNEFGLNQDKMVADIEEAAAAVSLPEGVEEPQVLNFSLSDLPVVTASASSSDLSLVELKELVAQDLQPLLENLEQVSQVTVSGGQELQEEIADESVAESETAVQDEPADPGRLPEVLIQGAQSFGINIEHAREVTPELLAGLGGNEEQMMVVLQLIPPETLLYAPPETLSLLPKEFIETLDSDLRSDLDELAADYGGVGQHAFEEVIAMLAPEEVQEEATAAAEPTTEPTEMASEEISERSAVNPVDLPDSWVAVAAQAGQELSTTADLTLEVMTIIVDLAPQLLADLEPEMWRAIDPAAAALALPVVQEGLDEALLVQLEAIQLAANAEEPEPVALPDSWIQAAAAAGQTLESTADINAVAMEFIASSAPQLLDDLTAEMVLAFPLEVQAALPEAYLAHLDQGLLQTLSIIDTIVSQLAEAEGTESSAEGEVPDVEPVELPDSWIAAAAQAGEGLATTADLTPEIVSAIANFAPHLFADLEPSMWRALDPETQAAALEAAEDDMGEGLLAELQAIQNAAKGEPAEPVVLPPSWVEAAQAVGFTLESTDDINAEAIGLLAAGAPQLLDDLTDEMILAFAPDVQAALPEEFVTELDDGLQATLAIIAIRQAQFEAAQTAGEAGAPVEETPEPTATLDPARLPEVLIQGAQSFGLELESAADIPPDFMRQVGAFGPQGMQILQLLTPGNLRALQPEVIALLPAEFLETLDADLRTELDELASEYGGAGQLALDEAKEAAEQESEASADAPPLSGIWLEPGPDGEPSQFQTAADILNNPFVPGAAAFLNVFPDSPQVENPADWMSALSTEVLAYLAEGEEDFVANLSPIILELMSPEALTFLLENHEESLDEAVAERLADIVAGEVTVFVPESTITRTDGNPSVLLNLFKDGDANTVAVAQSVFDELAAYENEHPEVKFNLVFEQATFIEESISAVAREGLLGAFFAVLVVLIFLSGRVGRRYKLSWRATIVVGISIPLSVFTAFLLMRLVPPTVGAWINGLANDTGNGVLVFVARLFPASVTLNIMTLSGLTVAVGRVVDDSIVVLENTYRFIQRGDDPVSAAIWGTKEVAVAIFASTATTVAVFLPLGLLGGIIGSFFLPFGLAVTYALGASFFVAISVVPAMAVLMIRKEHIPDEHETTMQRWYTPLLKWALTHRGATMAIAVTIFLGSLFLLSRLPRSFIPELGEPTINVGVSLPDGTLMADSDELVMEFESAISEFDDVETVQTEVGSAGGFEAFFGGGSVSQNLANVTISAENQEELAALTAEIREHAEDVFGEENVTVSAASQTGFGGFSLTVTADSEVELEPAIDDVKEALRNVDLDGNGRADIVNVSSSVDQAVGDGNGTINRVDGQSAINFTGELETENTLGVTNAAKQVVAEVESLPTSAEVTEGFESEQQTEGFRSMVTAIGYSIIIVYIIMALTFRSLIHPFTILFSLPFALVGAALALSISGSLLGISSMIGLMMLVGIVVTNAIILIELVQQLRKKDENAYDALVEGGRTRLRPIWMTALATVLALIPLAVSQEGGALIASELAITVIGGLLVSTMLTLIVVPVVYSLFDQLAGRLRRGSVSAQ